jgi:hypothetical protein
VAGLEEELEDSDGGIDTALEIEILIKISFPSYRNSAHQGNRMREIVPNPVQQSPALSQNGDCRDRHAGLIPQVWARAADEAIEPNLGCGG